MSPIRPKDRPGIGERWSGLGSGFRAAVAIPTVKSVPLPLPSAARCWPPPLPQVSLPFPSLPFPSRPSLCFSRPAFSTRATPPPPRTGSPPHPRPPEHTPPTAYVALLISLSSRRRRRPTESRTYASPTARARSRIGEVICPPGVLHARPVIYRSVVYV